MQYTTLGSSNLSVSEIAFGCMSLKEVREANTALLHLALDGGITFFDTADLYQQGENERLLGKAFKGMRQEVVIATKVGNQWRSDGSGWDWNPSKSYILEAAERSLRRLQTEYIDLYQLHGGTLEDPIDETIEAFELLQQQGKIRHYGISSIRPNVIREWVKRARIVSVMMQYSLLDRRPEESVLALLEQHNIGVLARGSLAQGLLAGKEAKPYLDYSQPEVRKAVALVQEIASASRTPAEVATNFVLAHPAVAAAVVGIRTKSQLEEALQLARRSPLIAAELEQLRQVLSPTTYAHHR